MRPRWILRAPRRMTMNSGRSDVEKMSIVSSSQRPGRSPSMRQHRGGPPPQPRRSQRRCPRRKTQHQAPPAAGREERRGGGDNTLRKKMNASFTDGSYHALSSERLRAAVIVAVHDSTWGRGSRGRQRARLKCLTPAVPTVEPKSSDLIENAHAQSLIPSMSGTLGWE